MLIFKCLVIQAREVYQRLRKETDINHSVKLFIVVALWLAAINLPPMTTDAVVNNKEAQEVVTKVSDKIERDIQELDVVSWIDNPQNCDMSRQYISAEEPFDCLDKQTPTQTQNTQPASSGEGTGGNCEAYRHLIARYSWDTETMMRAMRLESGCNPNAVGDQYVIGGVYAPSCGLLQVRTLPGRPNCEQLKNPAFNIATAYKIWQGQGYRAWSVLH
jgi:hypothetical protein